MEDYIGYIIDTLISLLVGGGIGFRIGNNRVKQKSSHNHNSIINQVGRDQNTNFS